MGIKDHIYMVVGCVNLLDLRIVASVILSVTVVNISYSFSIALKGEKINSFPWPSRSLDMGTTSSNLTSHNSHTGPQPQWPFNMPRIFQLESLCLALSFA